MVCDVAATISGEWGLVCDGCGAARLMPARVHMIRAKRLNMYTCLHPCWGLCRHVGLPIPAVINRDILTRRMQALWGELEHLHVCIHSLDCLSSVVSDVTLSRTCCLAWPPSPPKFWMPVYITTVSGCSLPCTLPPTFYSTGGPPKGGAGVHGTRCEN